MAYLLQALRLASCTCYKGPANAKTAEALSDVRRYRTASGEA